MTTEEKAKAYDKAIERAKYYYSTTDLAADIKLIGLMFPELKESKDERIRKELIEYLVKDVGLYPGENRKEHKWLRWLEKQGKKGTDKLQVSGELYEHIRNTCACIDDALSSETLADINDYLSMAENSAQSAFDMIEKQGEQKPTDTDNKFIRMRETKPKDISEFLDRLTTVEQEFLWEHITKIRELDKGEQKPADNVKPKFKVGDIIRHKKQGFTCKITAVDNEYRLSDCCGTHLPFDSQDAYELVEKNSVAKYKVGDTVYYDSFGRLVSFVIANIVEDGTDNPMYEDKDGNSVFQNDIVEQNPDDKVEPKFKVGDHIKPIDKCLGSSRIIEEVYDGWYVTDKGTLYFEFDDNRELVEQKPVWSEEDETMITDLSVIVHTYFSEISGIPFKYNLSEDKIRIWLNSLKDRVQPKQEWSEENKKKYIGELQSLMLEWSNRKENMGICIDRHIDKLLSLHPQSHWKPSDEQMKALKEACDEHWEPDGLDPLYTLYQDLKKLKEE